MCKASEDFPRRMFIAPISSNLSSVSIQHYKVILILFSSDDVCLKIISDFMNSFSVCNLNILKFIPESSPYSYYRMAFQTAILQEHSFFQCVTHMWNFNTGNKAAE
jgi:hypothetical protein